MVKGDEEKEGGPGPCVTASEVNAPGGTFVIRGIPALALARKRSPEPGTGTDTQPALGGGGESEMMMGVETIASIYYSGGPEVFIDERMI